MAKKKASNNKRNVDWAEAKRRCRLSEEDIRIAKELGFVPRSLIKNIPSPSQPWKASVKDWIHGLYEKKTLKAAKRKARQEEMAQPEEPAVLEETIIAEEDWDDDIDSGPTQKDVWQTNE